MRKPRERQRGRSYTISCTDAEWEAVRAGAAKAGKRISPWFVECALTVDPWPERRRRLVLDAGRQRAVVRGVGEIARGLGAEPGPGRAGGVPQFIGELRALFETRLRGMRPDRAKALLREVFGEERAAAIAAAIVPEAPGTPETPAPPQAPAAAESSGMPEESAAGGEPRPDPEPGTDAEPQGRLI